MGVEEHKRCAHDKIGSLKFAVVVTSDTRTKETDSSGKTAIEILEKEGHQNTSYEILINNDDIIKTKITRLLKDNNVDFIITSGGTGCGQKDVTIEAVTALYSKHLPGFGEMFRSLSIGEIGTAAFMSRASLGIAEGKAIFSVPGSTNAIKLALNKLIIPELGHIIWEARR